KRPQGPKPARRSADGDDRRLGLQPFLCRLLAILFPGLFAWRRFLIHGVVFDFSAAPSQTPKELRPAWTVPLPSHQLHKHRPILKSSRPCALLRPDCEGAVLTAARRSTPYLRLDSVSTSQTAPSRPQLGSLLDT